MHGRVRLSSASKVFLRKIFGALLRLLLIASGGARAAWSRLRAGVWAKKTPAELRIQAEARRV
jgi:hypothetical protein